MSASAKAKAVAADETRDSCGVAGGDDVNLKKCTACHLVKYCGVECQRNHRPEHKAACKKRAAELKDELLFKQPESTHLGDCPICILPIPIPTLGAMNYNVMSCCTNVICYGCVHANTVREIEGRLSPSCPFCRTKLPKNQVDSNLNLMKRVEAKDPLALHDAGMQRFQAGDYVAAVEYWKKAAGLGHIEAHYHLSGVYKEGLGVDQDMKKFIYHEEQAAIGGHPKARHCLGVEEWNRGNIDRAVKHFIIVANLGCDESIEKLKKGYACGAVGKDDFAAALRAHQAAVDAMKSPQRDTAKEFRKRF